MTRRQRITLWGLVFAFSLGNTFNGDFLTAVLLWSLALFAEHLSEGIELEREKREEAEDHTRSYIRMLIARKRRRGPARVIELRTKNGDEAA